MPKVLQEAVPEESSLILRICAALILLGLIADAAWIIGNGSIHGQDAANHLSFSVDFFRALKDLLLHREVPLRLLPWELFGLLSRPLPHQAVWHSNPAYLPAALFYAFFGTALCAAKLSNGVYLAILGISLYGMGRNIAGKTTGLLAVALCFMYPLIFQSSRQYGADLPAAAMTTLALRLMLRTDGFKDRKAGILAGLAAGAALMVKGQALLFLVGPALYLFGRTFLSKRRPSEIKTPAANLLLSLLAAAAAAALGWGPRIPETLRALFIELPRTHPPSYSLVNGLCAYGSSMYGSALGPGLFLLFLASLMAFARSRAEGKGFFLTALAVPIGYFAFLCGGYADRYLLPILPILALISAWGLLRTTGWKRCVLLPGVLLYLAGQFAFLTYGAPPRQGPLCRWLSCGTDYDDARKGEDPDRLREVLRAIGPGPAENPARPLNVLVLSFLQEDSSDFESRYRLMAARSDLEVYELFSFPDEAIRISDSADILLMRLPGMQDFQGWPPRHALLSRLRAVDPSWERLGERLYSRRKDYGLAAVIDAPRFRWAVYKKRQNPST
ncbi:MAG: glycosyltransferase family 39 protein [Elusimicrobiota bacterium]|jgi:hypothetical protein